MLALHPSHHGGGAYAPKSTLLQPPPASAAAVARAAQGSQLAADRLSEKLLVFGRQAMVATAEHGFVDEDDLLCVRRRPCLAVAGIESTEE